MQGVARLHGGLIWMWVVGVWVRQLPFEEFPAWDHPEPVWQSDQSLPIVSAPPQPGEWSRAVHREFGRNGNSLLCRGDCGPPFYHGAFLAC
eukprot:5280839-Pyramimonas_sp.AAC.2